MNDSHQRWLKLLLRIAIAGAALGWLWHMVDIRQVWAQLTQIGVLPFSQALVLTLGTFIIASWRWAVLIRGTSGKSAQMLQLLRLYLVGHFYNTVLPANIAGEFVRGHYTKKLSRGDIYTYALPFFERSIGLLALFIVAGLSAARLQIARLQPLAWLVPISLLGLAAVIVAPSIRFQSEWPPYKAFSSFTQRRGFRRSVLIVFALSIVVHLSSSLSGHVLIHALDSKVSVGQSLTLIPICLAATYIPSIAGLGVRELAFATLFALSGVQHSVSIAASLGIFGCQISFAFLGGILHALYPGQYAQESMPP